MDLLADYSSDDGEKGSTHNTEHLQPKMVSAPLKSAPQVFGAAPVSMQPSYLTVYNEKSSKGLTHNPLKSEIMAPTAGPQHPFRTSSFMPHMGAAATYHGFIEQTNVEKWAFDDQLNSYNNFGHAIDSTGEFVGTGDTSEEAPKKRKRVKKGEDPAMRAARAEVQREFELKGTAAAGEAGPWAEHRDENQELLDKIEAELADRREDEVETKKRAKEGFDVNADLDRRDERKISHLLPERHTKDTVAIEATTIFHGKKGWIVVDRAVETMSLVLGTETDYQGRSWVVPPSGTRPLSSEGDDVHDCFLPKEPIHRYAGHSKGVQAIRWFPDTGHLLLSASYDGKAKIWDVHNNRSVRRSYIGHSEGIRDANFTHDGRHFITGSFDRFMRYWDTETGQCVSTFCNRKVPYQVKFHPTEHHVFLMASSDNRIWQWDVKSGQTVQEYNHHIQAVNSVLFCEEGKRFVSTSDDKKILVWEYGIPVPMKYISDPTMHSIPTTALHPWSQHFVAQSMENEIHVYGARDRFRRLRKKVFRGHTNAGFACQITFSPNGRYMASGDGEGRLYCWDWKSSKQLRRFRAHYDGPCIDAQWHPLEPSLVATCGWDGLIKLWA